MTLTFHADHLDSPDVQYLLQLHYAELRAISPPEACHVLASVALRDRAVTVWAAHEDGELKGIGALKELASGHGEVKSMRTVPEARGCGVGRAMLRHIMAKAKARGYKRLSLETGNTQPFHPALNLYASEGFRSWGPFADYNDTPFTSFLSRAL
jgi:putative acetyltransferase